MNPFQILVILLMRRNPSLDQKNVSTMSMTLNFASSTVVPSVSRTGATGSSATPSAAGSHSGSWPRTAGMTRKL